MVGHISFHRIPTQRSEQVMWYFNTTSYMPSELLDTVEISTPLGRLERQYSMAAGENRLEQEQVVYGHHSRKAIIRQWVTSGCQLEELFVVFSPRLPAPATLEMKCEGLLIRLEALSSGGTFDAELSWLPGYHWTDGYGEPGECLEARSWINSRWKVTVGTEDSERLAIRSRTGKWMPHRLANYFDQHAEEVVKIERGSFSIHLPELYAGEKCQLQFVIASGVRQEDNMDLWLAVDQMPEVLLAAADCA